MNEIRAIAINRIQKAILQNVRYDRAWSHYRLVKEYLQRIRHFVDALLPQHQVQAWPFPDVAAILFPGRFENESKIENFSAGSHAFKICFINYVHFREVEEEQEVSTYQLPNPYEPIVRLRERGGTLIVHKGLIETCMIALSYQNIVAHPHWKPLDLDDTNLDILNHKD